MDATYLTRQRKSEIKANPFSEVSLVTSQGNNKDGLEDTRVHNIKLLLTDDRK